MNITRGLFDHMVLQRTGRNRSDAAFAGSCDHEGVVTVRATRGRQVIRGLAHARVGRASGGAFRGRLQGLPAGGPYDIQVCVESPDGRVLDRLTVRDVLVGDVWILAGQSNMEGIGWLEFAPKPDPLVRAFYMHDVWQVAKDPIHNLAEAVDPVHADLSGGVRPVRAAHVGVGPGVSFGQAMLRLTGVPQGLLACAHGGTSMAQWDPKLKPLAGKSLYGAMLRRFHKNGSRVAGVVWYQGESDAMPESVGLYTDRMRELVAAMRRDFGDPRLPITIVQLSRVCGPNFQAACWNSIQEQQRRLPERVRHCAVVPAIDLALDDSIHISGFDQIRLGRRLAQAMHALKGGRRAGRPPIALGTIAVQACPKAGTADVIVTFDHVVGRLQAAGPATGFEIVNPSPSASIYRVDLDGRRAILHTILPVAELDAGTALHYGYGTNPYCNITDGADRSLPVFGPVRLGRPRARTPFINRLRVSGFRPCDPGLKQVGYPTELALTERSFPTPFCDLHLDIGKTAPAEVVVFYVCRLCCAEPMRLAVHLGYDGPVKAWVDGRLRFHDPSGTNPAVADRGRFVFRAEPGEHEIVVGLGSNQGRAWGIFLRLERLDVPARLLQKGPGHYAMPEILG